MAVATDHQTLRWISQSNEHREKFQKLQEIWRMNPERIIKIGSSYVMCKGDEFKINKESRDGTCVYIGLGRDGKEVAIKCMLTEFCQHIALNESMIYGLTKMGKSPNVARYLNFLCSPDPQRTFTYIVLELCEFSLVEYVRRAKLDHQIAFDPQRIIKEILTGLTELHKDETILHRDLKPENVLVDADYHIRLADFGVSKQIITGRPTTVYTSGKGNTEWQAAESIPNRSNDVQPVNVVYKRKSDIQVAGMLSFYVMTMGNHPFGDVRYERARNIVEGNPVGLHLLTDPVEKEFVMWLIQKDIEQRPFAHEALKHPYLMSLDEQLQFLALVGDQSEVARNEECDIVTELNTLTELYPNGWKAKLPVEIIQGFSQRVQQYNNNITSLLRFLRNVKNHFYDDRTPARIRELMVDPARYLLERDRFFTLPMCVHRILRKQARNTGNMEGAWVNRPNLKSYF